MSTTVQTVSDPAATNRDTILDAAEVLFGELGFAGTSMRAIAQAGGVAQALLHYHFDTKDQLFDTVVKRRTAQINAARLDNLAAFDARDTPPTLSDLLHALFAPALAHQGGGVPYARILATIAIGGAREQGLVRDNYDAIALRFIEAIKTIRPALSHADAAWGYSLAIATLVSAMARTGRAERLAREDEASDDILLDRIVRFAAAGIDGYGPK